MRVTKNSGKLLLFIAVCTIMEIYLVAGSRLGIWQLSVGLSLINLCLFFLLHRLFLPHQPRYEPNIENATIESTLEIANETLPFLRRGLNEDTARQSAEIIQKISEMAAVAITDKERVLAFIGVGCDKHQPGEQILTEATRQVIATGQYRVVPDTTALNCSRYDSCDCPLGSAVIVPLKNRDEVVGSLKLYSTSHGIPPSQTVRLAIGIAQLLSIQMELAELDRQAQLITQARLEALHAQINPHFFFNTLNTIVMYSRTDPEKTRQLLIHLAELFRKTLKRQGLYISFKEELECIDIYFALEQARFGEKISLVKDVDESLLSYEIPLLSIQPLVENAVKHGLTPKIGPGTVFIGAHLKGREIRITISDDGVGIPRYRLNEILKPGYGSGNGVGLSNVHERFKSLYGEDYGLRINSKEGVGTKITMRVPLNQPNTVSNNPPVASSR
ncbi:MAG: histidine kinase [Clostridia bacterium]|nr:histidine kinase [Clostridia bacterium]